MGRFVVVGDATVDQMYFVNDFPEPGSEVNALRAVMEPGGAGGTVATVLGRLGNEVRIATRVGTGPFSELALKHVRDAGVDDSLVQVDEHLQTSSVTLIITPDAQRTMISAAGASRHLDSAELKKSAIVSSDALVMSAYSLVGGRQREYAVKALELAREAGHVEVEVLEGASGYHDPTITALGGLKLIEYRGAEFRARDVVVSEATRRAFADSLLFFYSGRHARTKPSLDLLSSRLDEAEPTLHRLKAIAYELEAAFSAGDLRRIAEIIGEQQALKQQLPGKFVDDYVLDVTRRVREVGAYAQLPGGKISAFVIVACPDAQHDAVRRALPELEEVHLGLEPRGTRAVTL